MKIKNKLAGVVISAAAFLLNSGYVFADDDDKPFSNITGTSYDLGVAIGTIISWVIIIAGLMVLLYLILAGIKYITSSGDPGKTEEAQKQIIYAIIGLAIVVLAFTVIATIEYLFDIDIRGLGFKPLSAEE